MDLSSVSELWHGARELIGSERMTTIGESALILVVGILASRLIARAVARVVRHRAGPQQTMIVKRGIDYSLTVLVLITVMRHLGIDLSVFVGAAGLFTVAIGFASQTSASNLISGLFLMAEQPFVVGDVIKVGASTGEVISVDLLSVKLRTFDNLLIRIPNESLLKAELTNLSHFPIRRVDLQLRVVQGTDIARVRALLEKLAADNVLSLDEPQPFFMFRGFGESGPEIQFSVWAARECYLELKNSIQEEISMAFEEHGIQIPSPHRSLAIAPGSDAFPIRLVSTEGPGAAGSGHK